MEVAILSQMYQFLMTMGRCFITLPPPPDSNGHDYVDLDLPSGTLWATCNVGASKPSDYGQYFQWGDTQGYTKDQIGKNKRFDENNYKFSDDHKYYWGDKLKLEDDAAHVNMGGDWHMPSPSQFQELIDNTTSTWTTQNGVNGRLFTSKNNGKSIFIPAAGRAWGSEVQNSGSNGNVWSFMVSENSFVYSQRLYFHSDGVYLNYTYRYYGHSVRGVLG